MSIYIAHRRKKDVFMFDLDWDSEHFQRWRMFALSECNLVVFLFFSFVCAINWTGYFVARRVKLTR